MNPVAAKLRKDHDELERLLQRLADAAAAAAPAELSASWSALEGRLIRHMEVEERFLLPLIEASDPLEVERIRREHTQIRDLLVELGVAVDLHTAREQNILQLIELLRTHAAHEDAALYALAGDKASSAVQHSISAALKSALRTVARTSGAVSRARL